MVRFAAYADSDDDASSAYSSEHDAPRPTKGRAPPSKQPQRVVLDDDEDGLDERDDASSQSADTYENQQPTRRAQQARRESLSDEEEEESGTDNSDDESSSSADERAQSVRQQQRAVSRVDTSIIPWAQQIGFDAQKMHVMQTALFRMPEEARLREAEAPPRKGSRMFPQRRSLSRKHSRDSEGADGLRNAHHRPSFAHDIDAVPFTPSRKYARVESADSAVTGYEGALLDAGLSLGRSFRVGWGPNGILVHSGQLCAPSTTKTTTANTSVLNLTSTPFFSPSSTQTQHFLKLLEHHLAHTPIAPDYDGVPLATPSSDLNFSSFANLFPPSDRSLEASLYRLGHALFDPLPFAGPEDLEKRMLPILRRRALSAWLRDAVAPTVESALRESPLAPVARTVLTHLSGYQVARAARVAMDGGAPNLATLVAQIGGDASFRAEIEAQLEIWRSQKADTHIDEDTRRVYALLAGIVGVLPGSGGLGPEKCDDLVIAEGLDWKRVFGLYLWYAVPMDEPLEAVWREYQDALDEGVRGTAKPAPWYIEGNASTVPWRKVEGGPPDALFALIRLFSDPDFSLSEALTPSSFSPSPSDVSLPWHLYILLSRSMHFKDLSDRESPVEYDGEEVEGYSASADLLASQYAHQLEEQGMLQEAVFVLLHLEGPLGRKKAIKDLLTRNASLLDDWVTRGLVGSLKIPMAWVEEAKAIHALDNSDLYAAYEHYSAAGLHDAAHAIVVRDLAPEAVIRQDLDLLRELLERIPAHAVEGWQTRGKAYLDYAHAMTRLPALRHSIIEAGDAVPDAAENDELDELCRSVPKLLTLLPEVLDNCESDPRHLAALTEMSAGLVNRLDAVRPLALAQATHTGKPVVDEATRLRHIRSTALERFMQSIEVV